MPKLFKSLAVLFALSLVLAGCKINSINYFPPVPAHIRVVNVLGTTTPIDITANGANAWTALAFEGMTGYQDFDNKATIFTVSLAGAGIPLIAQTLNLAGNAYNTLVVYGTTAAPSLGVMADATQPPPSGKFQLNIFDAAPVGNGLVLGTYPIDIYLTTPGQAIDTLSPNYKNIQYTNGNILGQFTAGQYQLRLTIAGGKTVIYDSGPLTFQEKTSTDLIIYSRGSTVLANVILNDSDGAGQQVIANSLLARLKVVNAAFQTGPVNQLLNGIAIVSNLAFGAYSTYSIVPSGTGTVTFEASSAPGATIASLANTFGAAIDQSIFVTGFAGSTSAVALIDNNFPPVNGFAAVRFVNASPNSAPLNVFANDVKQATALGTNATSAYVGLFAGLYTLTFKDSVTGVTVLTFPDVVMTAGQTSSVYVLGATGALSALVTPDTP